MGGANGRESAQRPLTRDESDEIRLAIGRLLHGANELFTIALVMPIFLAGAELAAEGFDASGALIREGMQRNFDRASFVGFGLVLFAFALRARIGASRAKALLADALADDPALREKARARLERLGGPPPLRRAQIWIVEQWRVLLIVLIAIVAVTSLLPMPNLVWVAAFLAVGVAMDVRWRAMVADAADQLPP